MGIVDTIREENRRKNKLNDEDEGIVGKIRRENRKMETKRTQTPATTTRTTVPEVNTTRTQIPTPATTARMHAEAHRTGQIADDPKVRNQHLQEVIDEEKSQTSIPGKLKRAIGVLSPLASLSPASQESQVDNSYAQMFAPKEEPKPESPKKEAYKQRYNVSDAELNDEIAHAKYNALSDDQKRRAINATTQTGWTAEQISGKRLLKQDGYTDEDIANFGNIARQEKYSSIPSLPDFKTNSVNKIDMSNDATYQHMTDEEKGIYDYLKNTGRDDEASDYYWHTKPQVDKRVSDEIKAEEKALLDRMPTAGKIAAGVALTGYSAATSIPGSVESFLASAEDIASGRNPNGYDERHRTKWNANNAHDLVSEMIEKAAPNAKIGNVNLATAGYDVLYSTLQSMLGAGAAGRAYTVIMGMGAAAEEAEKLSEQGVDRTRIVENALAKGIAEAFFEKFSIDNLVKTKSITGWKSFLKESLKQAGIEGSEEVFTEISNQITDRIIMGEDGEYAQNVNDLMAQGMSEEDAKTAAARDVVSQVLLAGIEGFLSGGLAGAGMNAMQTNFNAKTGKQLRQNLSDEDIVNAYKDVSQEGGVSAEYANRFLDRIKGGKTLTNTQVGALANQSAAEMQEEIENAPKRDIQKRQEVITDVYNKNARLNTMLGNNKAEAVNGAVVDTTTPDFGESTIARIESIKDDGTVVLENGNEANLDNLEFSTRSQEDLYRGTVALANELGLSTEDANAIVQAYNTTTDVTPAQYLVAAKESIVKGMYGIDSDIMTDSTYTDRFTPAQKEYFTSIGEKMQTLGTERAALGLSEEQERIGKKIEDAIRRDTDVVNNGKLGTVTLNGVVFDKKNYADYGAKMQNLTARQKATVRQGQALVKFTPGLNINFIESKKDGNRFYYVDENGVERTLDENGHYAPSKHQIVVDLNSGSAGEGMSSYTLAHELVHYVRDWSAESFKKMGEEVVRLTNGQKLNDKFTLNDLIHAKMRTENLSYDSAFEEVVAQSFESMLTDEDQNVIKMLSELNKADSKTFNFIQKYIVNMGKKIAAAYNAIKDESLSIEGKYIASLNDDYKRLQKLFAESVHAAGVAQSKALARMKNGGVAVVPDANITDKLISDNNIGVDQLNSGLPLSAADIHLEGKSQVRTDNVPEYKQIITVTASGKVAKLYTIDKNGKKKVQKMTVKELRNMKLREYLETSEAFDRRCKEKNLNKEKEIKRCIDNIDKVFEETQEFLQKLQDDSKYRFIGLQDCENQNVIINYGDEIDPETGERIPTSIVLSAMVNNGEYQVNIDFTKVCARREALQKLLNKITKTAANTSVNGNEQRVNLTAENIYAINTMLAQEGIDTACLICFVESKRYNINSLYQEKFIDVWNKQVKAECKKLGIKPEYFSFSSRDVSSGKGQLTPAEIDQQENLVENYRKKYGGDLNVNENKKVDEGKVVKQIKDYITNAAKTYADGQTTGEANELKLLTLADLITPEGRTSLEQDHKTIEQLLAKRLGTSAPKSVEAYTPYNGEIELLEGSTSSVLTKDINKYLKSIGGVRSQSFSDFMGCHLYDVMQRTAALAARGFPAHTYTKEIYRAILFGMCGEKTNLSAVFEIKADVNSWDAGLNKKGDYALSDYNAKENGETEWVQSIDIAKSIKLQNTEGYSKDCGIIGVGHSWRHIMKMQSDPEIRMIIGYHRSSLPVIISDLSQMNKSADYTSVQNTLEFKGLAKNNYRTPDGVPSYATPPQDAKTFDIDGTKRKSSFSMRDNKYVAKRFASRSALKAEFLKNCRAINRNYEKLKGEARLAVETEAGRITLTDLLNYANENGLSLVTKKANKNDAVGHEVEIKKSREVLTADGQPVLTAKGKPKTEKYVTDSFHLYEDLENTSDPYLTADHYIAACLRNGLIPEFYEFTHKFDENGRLVPDVNYYKNLYDFNVIDRLGTIGEDGKFYNADGTIAYAPQTEVSVLDANGNCVWDTPEWREAREKCMDDANRRRAKAEMVNEKILKALVKNKYDAVRTAIDWRTGKDIKSPVAVSSLSKYTNTLPLVQDVKKQTRQSIDAFSKKATEPIDKEYANALIKYGEDSPEVKAIIERAAEEAGYNSPDLYHGTPKEFGFTKFDLEKLDDKRSIFLTTSPEMANSYSRDAGLRRITEKRKILHGQDVVNEFNKNYKADSNVFDVKYLGNGKFLVEGFFGDEQTLTEKQFKFFYMNTEDADEKGNYELKARLGNALEIDAKGGRWNFVPFDTNPLPDISELDYVEFEDSFELVNLGTGETVDFSAPNNTDTWLYSPARDKLEKIYREYREWNHDAILKALYTMATDERVRGKPTSTTREISQWAVENGYDSVVIRNLFDNGGRSIHTPPAADVYIIFNPNDVKSLDPITYDENGDIIPLSERFNPENEDIRYQSRTGAASFNELYTFKDGKLYPKNVKDLSTEDWTIIRKAVNRLGYGIESDKVAKEVFSRYTEQTGFNPDQSEAIARAYGVKSGESETKENPVRMKRAEKYFGTTTDFAEAGYLMRDGKLLDFSGHKFGGPRHTRSMDHREINAVFDTSDSEAYDSNTRYMTAFISEGQIRLMDGTGITIGEIEPNAKQYALLEKFIERTLNSDDYFATDIINSSGNNIENREYSGKDSPQKIINDIKYYYKNWEMPYQSDLRAFYQTRDTRTQAERDADTIKDLRELLKAQGKVVEFSSKSLQSIAKSLIGYSGAKETTDVNKVANELGKFYRWVINSNIDTGTTDDEKTYAKIYAKTEKIAQALGVPQSDDLAREVIESMFAAERLKTVGTQHAEKIAELKAKHKNELFNEKLASDIYYGRKIKELREQRDRKLEEQRQHTSEQKAKERESRNMRQIKERIYKKYNDLAKRLTSPSEKRYVPADLVNTVASVLDGLNLMQNDTFMSGERAGETIKSKARANEKLALLKTKYDALQKDETYKAIYDPVVADMLQSVIDNIGDTPVEEMTLAQMQDVYTLLNTLDHTIREAVKVTLDGKKIDAFETGLNMMNATNSVRGKHERAPSKYLNSQLRADTMFNRFAGYTPNSDWSKMARRLNEGQNKMTSIIVEGTAAFQDLVNKTKELAKLTDYKDLVDIGLTDDYGHTVPITRGMMLSLYMHLQNADNAKHAMSGGLTLPNIPAYYKGNNELAWGAESRRVRMPEAIDFLQRINNELTDYEREWVKRAHWFFDEYSRNILNEATMQAYGFKKANVDNYFPIRTDPKYRSASFETIARNFSLENAGFMKERKHASNPILLEDLTDVIFDQLNKTARYAGIMPAVKDFNKVYNTILPGYTSSLQKVINDKFGEPGTKYIENLLADLQGARKSEKTELMGLNIDRARGHMAQAVLSLNLRVAASQAASYPTAAAEIGWKPLAKALAHGGEKNRVLSKADRELIAKYSPLLEWRLKGNSTTELGNIKDTRKGSEGWVLQKTKGLMGWISAVDAATVGRLWYAAQYYVDDTTDLEKGTDEYYKEVARVFNNVVEKTQPNYTVMQRPDVLRSTNNLVKAMTMFMTQRLQNFNILYDSAAQYAKQSKDYKAGVNNVTEDDVKQSQNQLVRAVSSQVVAGITLVGMKAIVDALMHNVKRYKDDDDETWLSILKTLGSDFLEAEASAVVFGSELYDLISSMITGDKYYAPTVQGISAITDLMQDIENLSSGMTQKKVIKLSTDICTFFGIPAAQAKKYVDAITGWYEDITDGDGIYSNVE